MSSTRGRRPVATSSLSPRSSRPSSSVEHVVLAVAPGGGRAARRGTSSIPSRRRTLPSAVAQRRGLAGAARCAERSTSTTSPPSRRTACASSVADRAAAEHEQPARHGLHARRLAVGPDAVELAQARDRRDDRVGAVGEHDVVGRVATSVDLDGAGPGEPAGAAHEVDAVVGQPALLAGVGVVGDHEVAPGERGLDVDLRGGRRLARLLDRLAGPQQRLGRDARVVRALAADQLALDDRDLRPPSAIAPAACSPGEPPPITITSYRLSALIWFSQFVCLHGRELAGRERIAQRPA